MARTIKRRIQKVLRCTVCGTRQVILRRKGRNRSVGHVKHLWCFHCKERTPHEEIE